MQLLVALPHALHDHVFPPALDRLRVGLYAFLEVELPARPADDLVHGRLAFPRAADGVDDLAAAQVNDPTLIAVRDLQPARALADAAHLDDVHQLELVEFAREPLFLHQVPQLGRLRAAVAGQFIGERGTFHRAAAVPIRVRPRGGHRHGERRDLVDDLLELDGFVEDRRAVEVLLVFAQVIAGHVDGAQFGTDRPQRFAQAEPVPAGQHHLADQQIGRVPVLAEGQCFLGAGGGKHLVAGGGPDPLRQRLGGFGGIVNNQDIHDKKWRAPGNDQRPTTNLRKGSAR